MKPMGGRTWKYWPASGPVFLVGSVTTIFALFVDGVYLTSIPLNMTAIHVAVFSEMVRSRNVHPSLASLISHRYFFRFFFFVREWGNGAIQKPAFGAV